MILKENKHLLTHHLEDIFPEIKKIKKKTTFLKSPIYNQHKQAIDSVLNGIEWDNTISEASPKDSD